MNTFTTPIFIETNPLSKEKVACGLVAVTPEKVFFKSADKKVSIAETLAGDKYAGYFVDQLKTLKNGLKQEEQKRLKSGTMFGKDSLLNPEYFTYLSKYNAGPVQFGDVKPYAGVIDEAVFEQLFDELVFDEPERKVNGTPTLTKRLNTRIKSAKLAAKADVNANLPEQVVPLHLTSARVLVASMNGTGRVSQAFDMDNQVDYLRKRVYELQNLQWALKQAMDEKKLGLDPMALIVSNKEVTGDHADLVKKLEVYMKDQFQLLTVDDFMAYADKVEEEATYRKLSTVLESVSKG